MQPIENFTIDEGVDANGVRKLVHFGGDDVVTQLQFDAEPILREAALLRQQNQGKKWNEGKTVGMIPLAVINQMMTIKDRTEREVAMMNWLKLHPKFITYEPHFATYTPRFIK